MKKIIKTKIQPFIESVEQYCFYLFLITLFIGLCPSIVMQPLVFSHIHIYFLLFYAILLLLGAPTVVSFLAKWGRFKDFSFKKFRSPK